MSTNSIQTPVRTTSTHANTSTGRRGVRETKPFYRTSEFLVYIASVAAVIGFGYSGDEEFNTYRTWMLFTVLSAAYIVSRGIAKAGSREGARDADHDVYPA
jgi:hypothetical protein